jgi:predicted HicB family RNase H-like nuclease
MTCDRKELLNVFEGKVYELLGLCERQRKRIEELQTTLERKNEEIREIIRLKDEWKAKYDDLLTARIISLGEGEKRNARKRLSDLIKEVDKCIYLLKNE